MFLVELILGFYAQSSGLIADSLDMLADASVYSISLYAVGRSTRHKAVASITSGALQVILACLLIADVIHRFIHGSDPISILMVTVGISALIANAVCFQLIRPYRRGEVHMRASYIFSRNDVLANLGVILSGLLVWITNSSYPDLAVGTAISLLVFKGGVDILRQDYSSQAT